MPSQRIIWAAAGLQNCCTASPEMLPRAAAPAMPNTARRAGFSQNSRVVIPLQESTCGGSRLRRQMRPTSPASAASSFSLKRVRGSVTAARVRPRSSSVTAHSSGGVPSWANSAATRPDLYGSGLPGRPSCSLRTPSASATALYCSVRAVRMASEWTRASRRLR